MTEPLRKVDLNLLLIFDTLYRERSVSVTAQKIGLTQSAVSLALNRLRAMLDDRLFVWDGRVMRPTGRCEEIAPKVLQIVSQIRQAILGEAFDAARIDREFSIATADYFCWLLGGSIVKKISKEAPGVTLYLTDVKPEMLEGHAALKNEIFVMPVGTFNTVGLSHQHIFSDRYVGVCAKDNPLIQDGMTTEAFLTIPQASFSTDAKVLRSHESRFLEQMDIKNNYKVLTPHYLVLPYIVSQSEMVVVMQDRLARYFSSILPLQLFIPPLPYPELSIMLYWHPSYDRDPAHIWLRSLIADLAKELDPLPPRPPTQPHRLLFISA